MAWTRKRALVIAGSVIATLLVTLIVLNLMPVERRIEHRIDRLYELGSPQFFRSIGVLLGPPVACGQSRRRAPERRRDLSVDARCHPQREADDHVRDLHLLVRRRRSRVRRRAFRAREGRRSRARAARLGRLAEDRRRAFSTTMRNAGVQIELYRPLHWYHLARLNNRTHRKLLVVDGRVGFTGGVGIADKWARRCAGSGPLARQPLPRRGAGRRADAGDVPRQLDQGHRRRAARRRLLPGARAGRRRARADVLELARKAAPRACSSCTCSRSRRRSRSIELASAYFVPDELTSECAGRRDASAACRVRLILPGPIIDTDVVRRASRARLGAAARRRRADPRVPADDVPLQGDDRRRTAGRRSARRTSTSARSG